MTTVNLQQGVPSVPQAKLTDPSGNISPLWYSFLVALWRRTGGATGDPSLILDFIADFPGDILFRAAQAWQGLSIGARYEVLRAGAQFPEWSLLDGNSFGQQSQNSFFAGPPLGGVGIPIFRDLASADLISVEGQYPGTTSNDDAAPGNIGEYISSQIGSGAAIALTSATPTDITSISLSPGDWDVWGNLATAPDGTTTQSDIKAWISTTSATDPGAPNGGAYAEMNTAIGAGLSQTLPVGSLRQTAPTSGPQIIYLSAEVTFATSTLSAFGFLGARRRR